MALSRIRQEDEEEEARRRRHYPAPTPPPPAEALAIIVPGPRREGGRRSFFTCRCLDGSIIELEEGERCPPGCNAISRGEITADTNQSVGQVILWSTLTGIGLGIGFYLVNEASKKLGRKYG